MQLILFAESQHLHSLELAKKFLKRGVFIDPEELAKLADSLDNKVGDPDVKPN